MSFSGATYEPEHDERRLTHQMERVRRCIETGWWTVPEIAEVTGDPHPSISAQIRNLRKPPLFFEAPRRRRGGRAKDLWEYTLGGVIAPKDRRWVDPRRPGIELALLLAKASRYDWAVFIASIKAEIAAMKKRENERSVGI